MSNKNIIDVATVDTLTNTDSLFVNSSGSLKQILMNDISVGGGMQELLWENPTPTAEFGATSISVDYSEYDEIVLYYKMSNGSNNTSHAKIIKGTAANIQAVTNLGNTSGIHFITRTITTYDTGDKIDVTQASYKTSLSGSPSTTSTQLIPYRIYGVRNNLTQLIAPSVKIDKLWTNPSPDATFAAQTVNLDLNKYDKVEVVYRGHGWDGTAEITANMHTVISVGGVGILNNSGMSTSNSYYTYAKTRKATVDVSGVAFSTGYVSRITGEPSQDNNACIPQEIYGIKIETQPVIGGMTMELLWENASPTSNFAASQTISLDLSKYDLVKIQFNLDGNGRMVNSFDTQLNRACMFETLTYTRHFIVYEDKITFTDCTNVGAAIPFRIYGIKF